MHTYVPSAGTHPCIPQTPCKRPLLHEALPDRRSEAGPFPHSGRLPGSRPPFLFRESSLSKAVSAADVKAPGRVCPVRETQGTEAGRRVLTALYSSSSICRRATSARSVPICWLALSWFTTTLFLMLRARLAYLSVLSVSMKSRSEGLTQATMTVWLGCRGWVKQRLRARRGEAPPLSHCCVALGTWERAGPRLGHGARTTRHGFRCNDGPHSGRPAASGTW